MARFFTAILAAAAIMLQGVAAAPYEFGNGTTPYPGPTGTASRAPIPPTPLPRNLREVNINLPRP